MEGPRVAVLIFLIIFLLVSPDGPRSSTPRERYELELLLDHERQALDVLNHTKQGDFQPAQGRYLNLTGLREQDDYAWDLLPKVQERARKHVDNILVPWKDVDLGRRYKSSETIDGGFGDPLTGAHAGALAVPFYQNITGVVHGQWVRSSLEKGHRAPRPNVTDLSPRILYSIPEYNRNITGKEGDISFRFDEKRGLITRVGPNTAREIKVDMMIQDETSSGDGWDVVLYGVHLLESGSMLLSTTSDRFDGIFALPHFARSPASYILSKQLLNRSIPAAMNKQMNSGALPGFPWASVTNTPAELMFPTPHCEYIVLLQQNIIWPHSPGQSYATYREFPSYLEWLEHELRYPSGAPHTSIPDMQLSAVIFSPDCGFVLESKGPPDYSPKEAAHLHGPKSEVSYRTTRGMVELLSVLLGAQIYLLVRQMKDASTPSTRSRISFYTIAIMGLGDGFICLGSITIGFFMDAIFLAMVSTGFLAFLSVSFFGMKFLMDIWTVQAPERLERQRERERQRQQQAAESLPETSEAEAPQPARASAPPAAVITPAGADVLLPLPATARAVRDSGATPVILPPDQEVEAAADEDGTVAQAAQNTTQPTTGNVRRDTGAMYSRFYFILLGILFLSLNATTWPTTLRSVYTDVLTFAYLSFWVPQIHRNVMRNCRKALRWEFVAGQSILRLIPFYYFYTYEENVLYVRPDRLVMLALTAWVWIQIVALISQEILGPRFFVPDGWAPPAYDYHPLLREDDEESGANLPIGFTQATAEGDLSARAAGESKEHGKKTFDCAICMQDLDVPVLPPASNAEGEAAAASSVAATLFSRRAYMVTPCRHIFHSPCLEGWMRYKLQCPICRESLPPL